MYVDEQICWKNKQKGKGAAKTKSPVFMNVSISRQLYSCSVCALITDTPIINAKACTLHSWVDSPSCYSLMIGFLRLMLCTSFPKSYIMLFVAIKTIYLYTSNAVIFMYTLQNNLVVLTTEWLLWLRTNWRDIGYERFALVRKSNCIRQPKM